jgi:hypothetical protein
MNSNNGYNLLNDLQENNEKITGVYRIGSIKSEAIMVSTPTKHIMVALTESNSKYKGSSNKPTQKNTHRTLSIASGIDEGELESLLKEATDINILEIGKAKYALADSYSQEQTQEIMDKILPTETTNELAEVISEYTPKKRFFSSQRNSRMRKLISEKHV